MGGLKSVWVGGMHWNPQDGSTPCGSCGTRRIQQPQILDFFQNLIVTAGIGFGLVAIGPYIEARWIRLQRRR